jgi:hypothetical protein
MKPFWQKMLEKSPDELHWLQRESFPSEGRFFLAILTNLARKIVAKG